MKTIHFFIGLFLFGGIMVHADDSKLMRLKKRVGFDQRRVGLHSVADGGIAIGLPDFNRYPAFSVGWTASSSVDALVGAPISDRWASKKWSYHKNNEELYITLTSFGGNAETATNMMFKAACSNTGPESVFSAGPSDLGDISLIYDEGERRQLVFVRHSMKVALEVRSSDFNLINLARWIQSQMRFQPANEVAHQIPVPASINIKTLTGGIPRHLSKVAPGEMREISISPQTKESVRARVGEPLVIRVNPPAGADVSRYALEYDWGKHFRLAGMQGLGPLDRSMKPIQAGLGVYKYVLIDRETLLAYWGEVQIDIQP